MMFGDAYKRQHTWPSFIIIPVHVYTQVAKSIWKRRLLNDHHFVQAVCVNIAPGLTSHARDENKLWLLITQQCFKRLLHTLSAIFGCLVQCGLYVKRLSKISTRGILPDVDKAVRKISIIVWLMVQFGGIYMYGNDRLYVTFDDVFHRDEPTLETAVKFQVVCDWSYIWSMRTLLVNLFSWLYIL